MASPEEVQAQMQELREQNQNLMRMMTEMQAALLTQHETQNQHRELIAVLGGLPQALIQAATSATPVRAPQTSTNSMVDVKGLGKPPHYNNKEPDFVPWTRKVTNFVVSVHPGARDVLTLCQEAQEKVSLSDLLSDVGLEMDEDSLRSLDSQLFTVLASLTDDESFDIVSGTPEGSGLEAWRRLHRRWDPLTTGRTRGLLRAIMSPGRVKLAELQGAIERLEDLFRRYCARKGPDGERHQLSDDLRTAALEQLLPEELEKHCQLNRSRLINYDKMREEVVMYAEARGHLNYKPNMNPHSGSSNGPSGDSNGSPGQPDLSYFGRKGKGDHKGGKGNGDHKGKGKGGGNNGGGPGHASGGGKGTRFLRECWNCGKKGHVAQDCWAPSAKGKGGKGKGKQEAKGGKGGKSGKSRGGAKGAGSFEETDDRDEPYTGEVGAFELASFPVQQPSRQQQQPLQRIAITLDTGAGATAWPLNSTSFGELLSEMITRSLGQPPEN